jgi:hypothetical protein
MTQSSKVTRPWAQVNEAEDGLKNKLVSYTLFLRDEIDRMEIRLAALRNFTNSPHLDPNYRLEYGKLSGTIAIYKDLADMCGVDVEDGFYPDAMSLLEQSSEEGEEDDDTE